MYSYFWKTNWSNEFRGAFNSMSKSCWKYSGEAAGRVSGLKYWLMAVDW